MVRHHRDTPTVATARTNAHTHSRDEAPPLWHYLTDPARAMGEYGMFMAAAPMLARLPRGDGQPVLVLPGLMAGDASTRPLRRVLQGLGYDVYGWSLGRNIGPTGRAMSGMRDLLDRLQDRHGRPVSLIGWSLGGIFARELARERPDAVRQVVTLGSPFRLACANESRAQWVFDRFSHLHVEHLDLPLERDCEPLAMPATSIYSRFDGIVSWRACLDDPSPRSENIAVVASHLGMGHHPAVVWAVADRLAQPAGRWAPFRAPALLQYAYPRPDSVRRAGDVRAEVAA